MPELQTVEHDASDSRCARGIAVPLQFPLPGLPIAFLISAVLSYVLVRMVLRLAWRNGLLDYPGPRQSHDHPTPTGAGVAIVASIIFASLLSREMVESRMWWVILAGMAVLSVAGWIDDRKPLSSLLRLALQLAVVIPLIAWVVNPVWNPGLPWLAFWAFILVGVINAYNFMDGSDGMAGFQAVFSGLVMSIIFMGTGAMDLALAAALLAGSCAGFLPLNFPTARIFMGDSGSVPVGWCIAGLLLLGVSRGIISIPESFLVLILFLVDSGLTLLARVIRREQWYTAHKEHVYQRLIGHGWSHSRVLLFYQAINIVLVAPALVLARMYPDQAWTIAGVMFLLTSTGWYLASLRLGVRN